MVGCVATKGPAPAAAKDLYQSQLFRRRRAYAEQSGKPWFILSALYGLVEPGEVIEPYDVNITEVRGQQRRLWAAQVTKRLHELLGPLSGLVFELHAGLDYRDALAPELRVAGGIMTNPLQGLALGEQLHWYDSLQQSLPEEAPKKAPIPPRAPDRPHVAAPTLGLARRLTTAFVAGELDLSGRPGAPLPGWQGMPEVVVAKQIKDAGADDATVRLFITFTASVDRARDADRLWFGAFEAWKDKPWVFQPDDIATRSFTDLLDDLRATSLSRYHLTDVAAWRVIGETLSQEKDGGVLHDAVYAGRGDARELLDVLQGATDAGTPRLPMLAGPKVGPMWVRMLAYPGGATISSLDVLPVAVDVQVRRVTENLGMTDTRGQDLEKVRTVIQEVWRADVAQHGAAGPPPLADTCAALDPALWFFAKWGCYHCEKLGQRRPIHALCDGCRLVTS